jgi:hypothetical protein
MMHFLLFVTYILCIHNIAGDGQFSLDGDSDEDENNWNGMVVLVLSDENDMPEIVLSNELNRYSQVYCLTLEELFEATWYNTTVGTDDYGKHDEVSNSEIDFQTDVTWNYSKGADNKSFVLYGVPTDASESDFESMRFEFGVETSPVDESQWGLKYSFELNGYNWTSPDPNAKLVLVIEFKSCESEFESIDFSQDDDDDDEDENADENEDGSRRLGDEEGENENDDESDDGVSSEDSQELDLGAAEFINHGNATCVGSEELIPTSIAYGEEVGSDELHVVFDHFDCPDIIQDPYVGMNSNKMIMDSAIRYCVIYHILVVIGTVVFIF